MCARCAAVGESTTWCAQRWLRLLNVRGINRAVNTRWLFGVLAALFCLSWVEPALAGCTSTCEATLGEVSVDPKLDCAVIEASINDCNCAVFVSVDNTCSGALEVRSDELTCTAGDDCFALPAGESGAFRLLIDSTGSKQWSLPLKEAESGAHTLSISVAVSKYDGDPGCSVVEAGRRSDRGSCWVGLALVLSALARRTRATRS